MEKLILFSILFTVVLAWDETKHFFKFLALRLLGGKRHYLKRTGDKSVGVLLMYLTIPISIMYFAASEGPLHRKLLLLAIQLLAIYFLSLGISNVLRRSRLVKHGEGSEKILLASYALLGLFTPAFKVFADTHNESKILGKFTLLLSLPALAALALKHLAYDAIPDNMLLPNIDLLIMVVFFGLLLQITIGVLEKVLHMYAMRFFTSYLRLALGIVVTLMIIKG